MSKSIIIKKVFLNLFVLVILLTSCKKEDANNPADSWKTLASMPTPRQHFGLVQCNNLLYAIGGYNTDAVNKVEVYNPAIDSWATLAPMPTARGYLVVGSVANKIYAIGGIAGGDLNQITYTNVTEEYDPASNKWTAKSPFLITATPPNLVLVNQFITGGALNAKIYVAVGTSGGTEPTYIYDPSADTWTNTAKSIAKFNFQPYFSTSNTNSLFIGDGFNFLQYLSSENDWRILQAFLAERQGVSLAADDNNVYSIGGYNIITGNNNNYQVSMSNEVGIYNLNNSSWSKTASLNTKRHSAALIYNSNLHVVEGTTQPGSSDIPLSSVEVLQLK